MTKPEIKLSKWQIVGGTITGVDHNDLLVRVSVLRRPFNPHAGSRIETMKVVYVLLGDGV